MLSEVDFRLVYTSGRDEPVDFYLNALLQSSKFDLGLGFFNSSGFRAVSLGFACFIHNGGEMRFVINDSLSLEDKEAIEKGLYKNAEELIEQYLIKSITNLCKILSSHDKHFFNCLSWLISTKKLSIKVFIPSSKDGGIVHQKFGLFRDNNGNRLAFNGSANFSKSALSHNLETITCYKSWLNETSEISRIDYYEEYFNEIWEERYPGITSIPINNVRTFIRDTFKTENLNQLIEEEHELIKDSNVSKRSKENFNRYYKDKIFANNYVKDSKVELKIPISLRDYQKEAIDSWFNNNCKGLFEMATGTGKTITSLSAVVQFLEKTKKHIVLITCPYIHLVEQWNEEAIKFGLRPILVAENSKSWKNDLSDMLQRFKRSSIDLVTIITTNVSMTSPIFQDMYKDFWDVTIFVSDECHYLGSTNIRKFLPHKTKYRLGLSATPNRYYDEEGSEIICEFFDKTVYTLTLEDAIGKFLTPYYYYPILVEMTNKEFNEYSSITKRIQQLINYKNDSNQSLIENLLIKRARIQNNSETKLEWVEQNIINDKSLYYTLFYSGDQLFKDIKSILGYSKNIKIHEFTSKQNRRERTDILRRFQNRELQALIAMKCLDEGVDIPPTRTAYFLASSGNPREFIQRRGRILRKSEGKDFANIYDLISIPPLEFIYSTNNDNSSAVKSAIKKELKRVKEFSDLAINKNSSFDEIFDIALKLDLIGE